MLPLLSLEVDAGIGANAENGLAKGTTQEQRLAGFPLGARLDVLYSSAN